MPRRDVILIDDDPRRRAHIRAMLECIAVSNAGYCRREWLQRLDPPGLIFLVTTSRDFSVNAAVIAFAAKPKREDNLRAFGLGVSEYLHWPLCARDLRARVAAMRAMEEPRLDAAWSLRGAGRVCARVASRPPSAAAADGRTRRRDGP